MFNNGSFNITPYNIAIDNYLQITMDAAGGIEVSPKYLFKLAITLSADSNLDFGIEAVELMAESSMVSKGTVRRYLTTTLEGLSEAISNARLLGIEQIIISTSFAPGDTITIDTEKFTVKKNGQNILSVINQNSVFFNLKVGENTLQYSDNRTSRNIQAKVIHKDRWL
ncbi:phage distal tail protein [Anaerosolibacter sp.]|uniref:phage distal tail protein n=1 Tax=Anaerosolibacter sp. TaxID=1872527 RepID=UPI0039F0D2C5